MDNTSLSGYDTAVCTFEIQGELQKGDFCTIASNNKVKKCSGEKFFGLVINVRNGLAAVQTRGFIVCDGSVSSVGENTLVASGNSVSVSQDDGTTVWVTQKTTDTVGFIL